MLRHVTDDPVRAVTLAWRALPAPLRGLVGLAGPYGKAAALWGAGDRRGALTALEASPARLAAFSLAVDQPTVARSALARLSEHNGARPRLAARLAYREGRLADAVKELDGAGGWRTARLRRSLLAEIAMLQPGSLRLGKRRAAGAGRRARGARSPSPQQRQNPPYRHGRAAVDLRRVHDPDPGDRRRAAVRPAWTRTSARARLPGHGGGHRRQRTVTVDGVPYHRLLPWVMPGRMDRLYQTHLSQAARLTERLAPGVLHAASNYANAVIALALREATGLPVVYEVRGFWEDTWLSRHAANADLTLSDRYVRTRALETHCMTAADLVVTLGEAMREEIVGRGVPAENVIIVPNGVSESSSARCPTARRCGPASASSPASTSSAWFPAWSRTRASAPSCRPSRS